LLEEALKNKLLLLGAGEKSIRFRPPLTITADVIDEAFGLLAPTLNKMGL
jgi:L-lysine 6-transaminase